MAAQAVEVTLSGHVSRALIITDSDNGTSATVTDNTSSGTRFRLVGTGEMMDAGTAGVKLEYGAGGTGGAGLSLRYADIWFSGEYGRVSVGLGDQGGEGSVYKGGAAVIGTGHGQATGDAEVGNYYNSFDGGGPRNERLRYDSPSVGPVSAAISVGNNDVFSAGISVSQSFGDTSFAAGIGTVQWPGSKATISGSAGVSLAGGISISGAWGRGTDYAGMTIPADAGTPAVAAMYKPVTIADFDPLANANDMAQAALAATDPADPNYADLQAEADAAEAAMMAGFESHACDLVTPATAIGDGDTPNRPECENRLYAAAVDAVPGSDAMPTTTDPSFFQVAASYAFGDTSVGVSWYQSSDLYNDGSELVAIGAGVSHSLPKLGGGSNVYAAAQNYSVEDGAMETDDTVVMIGTRIFF